MCALSDGKKVIWEQTGKKEIACLSVEEVFVICLSTTQYIMHKFLTLCFCAIHNVTFDVLDKSLSNNVVLLEYIER